MQPISKDLIRLIYPKGVLTPSPRYISYIHIYVYIYSHIKTAAPIIEMHRGLDGNMNLSNEDGPAVQWTLWPSKSFKQLTNAKWEFREI